MASVYSLMAVPEDWSLSYQLTKEHHFVLAQLGLSSRSYDLLCWSYYLSTESLRESGWKCCCDRLAEKHPMVKLLE